jgi:hypothetical protein
MDWLKTLFSNHTFTFFFIVVGIPILVMGTKEIIKLLIKHRERMAMIEHGMDPDAYHRESRPIERVSDATVGVSDLSK